MSFQATLVQSGGPSSAIDYKPGSAVSAGDVIVQSNLVAVATRAISANELGSLETEGIFDVLKRDSQAISSGDLVYWDEDGEATSSDDSATNKLMGKAVKAALAGDDTVRVKLTP